MIAKTKGRRLTEHLVHPRLVASRIDAEIERRREERLQNRAVLRKRRRESQARTAGRMNVAESVKGTRGTEPRAERARAERSPRVRVQAKALAVLTDPNHQHVTSADELARLAGVHRTSVFEDEVLMRILKARRAEHARNQADRVVRSESAKRAKTKHRESLESDIADSTDEGEQPA